jgi:biotin-dependent carboxylase-like uncharacterized protein
MDCYSASIANRLLGNRDDAPVLEVLMQGVKLRVLEDTWLAVAGADLSCALAPWTACAVSAGTVIAFPMSRSGLWAYVAVPGGFSAERWFGSASVDARNGLGTPLVVGSQLSRCTESHTLGYERVGRRVIAPKLQRDFSAPMEFELLPGPQYDLFSAQARAELVSAEWTVSSHSDRTGFRLKGPELEVPCSIASEPVLAGSFQVPGNGQPIVTMVDGPTVGGYAKCALLRESDLDWFAQCRPGTKIRFRWACLH